MTLNARKLKSYGFFLLQGRSCDLNCNALNAILFSCTSHHIKSLEYCWLATVSGIFSVFLYRQFTLRVLHSRNILTTRRSVHIRQKVKATKRATEA